ncbi:MAG: hypothetical protein WBA07_23395, partial [Rivularia sp. (in: cyanobacteria)]
QLYLIKRRKTLMGTKSLVFSPDGKLLNVGADNTQILRVGDIEDMLAISCDWVRHYLENKPENDEDRYLCDGVGE